ncbi:ras and Rab interactor 3 isoform X2 [Brienomyrus brachyistius]|uniref:ras and Rab interactor 3 isoform X2 n=1 Tax=Brienomyrus brachyistius TaxID=42636 RepID=UPI0020B3C8CA|nr:ras and Rab interactor 3 isoform X2 [Brienomyrus brachyistius]
MITAALPPDAEPYSGRLSPNVSGSFPASSQDSAMPGIPAVPVSFSPTVTEVSSSLVPGGQSPSSCRPVSPPALLPSPADISILDKLIKTCPVWLQLGITESRATRILQGETPGIFLVRRDMHKKRMILSVRLFNQKSRPQVQDIPVKEENLLMYLEGSVLVFDDIFKLIAFYCVSRDILPFKLRLPNAIVQATKYEHMEIISSLGSDFWGSSLNRHCGLAAGGGHSGERDGQDSLSSYHNHGSRDSCEVEPPARSDGLWYVNPVRLEEFYGGLLADVSIARSQSLTLPASLDQSRPWRTALLPPHPPPSSSSQLTTAKEEEDCGGHAVTVLGGSSETATAEVAEVSSLHSSRHQVSESSSLWFSELHSESPSEHRKGGVTSGEGLDVATIPSLLRISGVNNTEGPFLEDAWPLVKEPASSAMTDSNKGPAISQDTRKKEAPIPPPRKNRNSRVPFCSTRSTMVEDLQRPQRNSEPIPQKSPSKMLQPSASVMPSKSAVCSLEGGSSRLDHDSPSASSTEEEADIAVRLAKTHKQNPTLMINKAKKRLSRVNLSQMLTGLISAEKKLQHRILNLAQDRDSYFGNLVLDYRAFTLEAMQKRTSSTEMLQEIRQMLTQLKGYLIQSTELQAILESSVYPEEKLESIIETTLFKCVLKPLRDAIYARLWDLHTGNNSLMKLRDNQQVVLNTTTTDLGVTTSVPESADVEKIKFKLDMLHKQYSPEKKISILLKACKLIYESMSVSCPGRTLGADDFLPVLMYVVAHSNITPLMLDVEYMMELMDPAMQLGEGSYYLTTTYGALEHIKNYDIMQMTRQLSSEVQDSIHRWERHRTLSKKRLSGSPVEDFVKVSLLEAGANTKTLGIRASTTIQDLCRHCAETFEVVEPETYRLYISVDGKYQSLTSEELPLSVKSSLHHSEHRAKYHFVYRPGVCESEADDVPCFLLPSGI